MGNVESGHNPFAVSSVGAKGAYQVMEKHWGKVYPTYFKQLQQHSKVYNCLFIENNYNVSKTITRYNGKGSSANNYFKQVRKECFKITLLGG